MSQATPPTEFFVYYKLHAGQAEAARAAFEQAREGQPVRLLQRSDTDPVFLTWMEIYGPALPDAAALQARVAAHMAPFAQGPRHLESFVGIAGLATHTTQGAG